MDQITTCINCPVGCRMKVSVSKDGKVESVSGNNCIRGHKYAEQECILPMRMITAVIPVQGRTEPLSVKTASPVPKRKIPMIMKELATVRITAPISIGDIIIKNVCGTRVSIVSTRNLD